MGSSPTKVKNIAPKKEEDDGKWAEKRPDPVEERPKTRNAKVSPEVAPPLPSDPPKECDEKSLLEGEKPPTKANKKGDIDLTDGIVQDYVNMEKEIYKLERKDVIKKYETHTIQADNLKNTVEQLEAVAKELRKQTEREKTDIVNIEQPSVKDFLKQQGTWDQRLAKEKSEYEDAVSKQESIEKELRLAKINYDNAQKIMDIYKKQTDSLYALHEKQDKLLERVFGTEYASEKENAIEGDLEDLMDWQQRVSLAMFKWANGRVLLVHALTQITFGINRWIDAKGMEKDNERGRYFAAAEARNNFIAAAQNVSSCRMYLNKVEFPYGTEADISQMEENCTKAFKNIDNVAEMEKALKVFQETQQKVASLIQWFDKVINDTIRKDLDEANNKVIKKQKTLREERLAFLKKKSKEVLGKEIQITYDEVDDDELEKELKALEEQALREIEDVDKHDVKEILDHSNEGGALPLAKLAPLPAKDALFGDVKQKMSEYDTTRKQFEKRNNAQREKQQMALQEKLRQRQQQKKPN